MIQEKTLHKGSINVSLKQPSLTVHPLKTGPLKGFFEKIANSSKRRHYSLNEDWEVELSNISYSPELNGLIKIPKLKNNKPLKLDGASTPIAWLASFMSLGIVRPMGIMFNASIIHDYCYHYGGLDVSNNQGEDYKFVEVNRETADRLFRDIISSIHDMPRAAWLCWFLVKIGWIIGVKYHYTRWEKPIPKRTISIVMLTIISLILLLYNSNGFITDRFHKIVSFSFFGLFFSYIGITIIARLKRWSN